VSSSSLSDGCVVLRPLRLDDADDVTRWGGSINLELNPGEPAVVGQSRLVEAPAAQKPWGTWGVETDYRSGRVTEADVTASTSASGRRGVTGG